MSASEGRGGTQPPVSHVRVRELMLLLGGETEDKNAEEGRLLMAKVTSTGYF